jgi:ABC-type branched-subunit amino acid transport system ATPase component
MKPFGNWYNTNVKNGGGIRDSLSNDSMLQISEPVLMHISGLTKHFGGLPALAGVSFTIAIRRITALIGPNGAGKTILINCLTGVMPPDGGTILCQEMDIAGLPAGGLPYGDKKRLEMARAFVSQPILTLLDEPVAGLNPTETARIAALSRHLRLAGQTILLVENDMDLVMSVSDHAVVLNSGSRIAEGSPRRRAPQPPGPGSLPGPDE